MARIDIWFPLYPRDYLSNADVAGLSTCEEGVLLRLWCLCWRQGYLDNDATMLLQMLKRDVTPGELNNVLARFFELNEAGQWVSPRQQRERQKAEDSHATSLERSRKANGAKAQKAKNRRGDLGGDLGGDLQGSQSQSQSPNTFGVVGASNSGDPFKDFPAWLTKHPAGVARLRASRNPKALAAELEAIRTGMHGPPCAEPIIIRALEELAANGETFNAGRFRGYCGKVQAKMNALLDANAPMVDEDGNLTPAARRILYGEKGKP